MDAVIEMKRRDVQKLPAVLRAGFCRHLARQTIASRPDRAKLYTEQLALFANSTISRDTA